THPSGVASQMEPERASARHRLCAPETTICDGKPRFGSSTSVKEGHPGSRSRRATPACGFPGDGVAMHRKVLEANDDRVVETGSVLSEQHLRGEAYRAVSARPGRRSRGGCGAASRWGGADRDGPSQRFGPRVGGGAGARAQPMAIHGPAKVITDLAVALALG